MILAIILILVIPGFVFADQRLVHDRNGRIVSILGPNDPAVPNTISIPDAQAISGKDMDKYEFSGGAVRQRAAADLRREFADEWAKDAKSRADTADVVGLRILVKELIDKVSER